jgi:hypothetical protein
MIILMILMLTNDYCFLLYIILVYMIMRLFGLMVNFATQLLKDDSLKANRSKPASTFEPHEPYDIYLLSSTWTHSCYFPHIRKGTRLLDSEIFRFVINQSVCSWSKVYTRCLELSFRCVAL